MVLFRLGTEGDFRTARLQVAEKFLAEVDLVAEQCPARIEDGGL
jgi:hypothetical protein